MVQGRQQCACTSAPGTESQQANSLLQDSFPGSNPNGALAQFVFVAPRRQRVSSAGYRTVIDRVVAATAAGPQVATAVHPFRAHLVSRDGSTAIATITYKVAYGNLTAATVSALHDAVRQGDAAGLTVQAGGTALTPSITTGPSVAAAVAIAAVVLLLTFASLAAAGLPLLTAASASGSASPRS